MDDVVWRLRFRDDWLYVYLLLEFQSSPDPWMALRMLVYLGSVDVRLCWNKDELHLKTNS